MIIPFRIIKQAYSDWHTPRYVFNYFNLTYGPFNLDVAASKENALCQKFFDLNQNGLVQSWQGSNFWMNPPYGKELKLWVKKAILEVTRGQQTRGCLLLPAAIETNWFHDFILNKAQRIYFLRGRLKFENWSHSNSFSNIVAVFNPKIKHRSKLVTTDYRSLDCRVKFNPSASRRNPLIYG